MNRHEPRATIEIRACRSRTEACDVNELAKEAQFCYRGWGWRYWRYCRWQRSNDCVERESQSPHDVPNKFMLTRLQKKRILLSEIVGDACRGTLNDSSCWNERPEVCRSTRCKHMTTCSVFSHCLNLHRVTSLISTWKRFGNDMFFPQGKRDVGKLVVFIHILVLFEDYIVEIFPEKSPIQSEKQLSWVQQPYTYRKGKSKSATHVLGSGTVETFPRTSIDRAMR